MRQSDYFDCVKTTLSHNSARFRGITLFLVGWLVVLRLNVPVNNFSVMSGRNLFLVVSVCSLAHK